MKVNDPNLAALGSSGATRAQQSPPVGEGGRKGSGGHRVESGQDEVQLSSLGKHLRTQAAETPERSAHLSKLASAYQAGTYRVDAGAVSHRVVSDAIRAR